MKVLYDHQIFTWQKFGGISRYFSELIRNSSNKFETVVSGIFSENEYIQDLNLYKRFPISKNFKGKSRLIQTVNLNNSKKQINNRDFDIFHPTYYDTYFTDIKSDKKLVITVYDMIHELYHDLINDEKIIADKTKLINHADAIIAISESTKNDILKLFPNINPEKIFITYLGNSFPISEKKETKKNYILFTGQRFEYKNFTKFIEAVAPLLNKYDLKLICTGKPFNREEVDLFDSLSIRDRVEQMYVNDMELQKLYNDALVFVFPSLYEGFGIPVLEAFSSGCPLVLSNKSSLPEIAKDGGYYFDPLSISDMRNKIEDVICSKTLQDELILKGYDRLKDFSWERCSEQTYDVYQSLME